jgi:hypothetical protein
MPVIIVAACEGSVKMPGIMKAVMLLLPHLPGYSTREHREAFCQGGAFCHLRSCPWQNGSLS